MSTASVTGGTVAFAIPTIKTVGIALQVDGTRKVSKVTMVG